MKIQNKTKQAILYPLLSVLAALVIGALFIIFSGKNPITAYGMLLKGAFGNMYSFGETIAKAVPLAFTGLAVTFAYRCGMFNIGAEGQLLIGALGGIWAALTFSFLPKPLVLLASFACGTFAGSLWGAIPGILKAKKGLNEVINTILMNYIAVQVIGYAVTGPLKEPPGYNPQTAAIAEVNRLAILVPKTRIHSGFLLALLVAAIVYYILFHTAHGFKLRAVGLNKDAAAYAGIRIEKNMVWAMAISGGIAGLGGSIEMLGIQYRLMEGFGAGYGFDGIAIALIGQLHPVGVLLASFLFGILRTGANTMQRLAGIPTSVVDIIQALIIFFVVGANGLRWVKKNKKGKHPKPSANSEVKSC